MSASATISAPHARTRAFARVIGPYVAIVTTVYAIRLPELNGMIGRLLAEPVAMLMLGTLMLGGGLVIIGVHRNWRGPIAVIISLFGWFIAVRGFLLIAAPDVIDAGVQATMLSPTATTLTRVFFGCLAALGILLAYAGWAPAPKAASDR